METKRLSSSSQASAAQMLQQVAACSGGRLQLAWKQQQRQSQWTCRVTVVLDGNVVAVATSAPCGKQQQAAQNGAAAALDMLLQQDLHVGSSSLLQLLPTSPCSRSAACACGMSSTV